MTMNDFQDDSKWGKELLRCTSTVSHLVTNWRFFAMQCKCIKSIQLQIFWWKRIRKASEHKQMKRNNEIDLFFCSCYCIASFYFSWFTQHYRPEKERKKTQLKEDLFSTDAVHNHRKQSIIVNFLEHFFVIDSRISKAFFIWLQFILAGTFFQWIIDNMNSREKVNLNAIFGYEMRVMFCVESERPIRYDRIFFVSFQSFLFKWLLSTHLPKNCVPFIVFKDSITFGCSRIVKVVAMHQTKQKAHTQ